MASSSAPVGEHADRPLRTGTTSSSDATAVSPSFVSKHFQRWICERAMPSSRLNSAAVTSPRSRRFSNQRGVGFRAMWAGASGSRNGACQSLDNHFDTALRLIGRNGNAARKQFSALIDRAATERHHGDLTASEAAMLIDNATLVRSRLWPPGFSRPHRSLRLKVLSARTPVLSPTRQANGARRAPSPSATCARARGASPAVRA